MKLIEVQRVDKKAVKAFLNVPIRLYKNTPTWIRPLDKDVEEVFSPEINPLFKQGEAIRWILENEQGEVIGRVAAFYDNRVNERDNFRTGGLGFFECIEDEKAAFFMFDKCKEWLESKGIEAMDGPVNFGTRERWWGLLVDGFDKAPNYCVNYHFPYYQQFFVNYGFQDYFQQYTYRREVGGPKLEDIFYQKAKRLIDSGNYIFKHIEKGSIEKYAEDFRSVYNKAWAARGDVPEMTMAEVQAQMKKLKPIVDERLIWFVYYREMPIAFMVMIPELNQLFKNLNGKLDLVGKLKFVYNRWRGKSKKILGLTIGVLPRFHGRGIESGIIAGFSEVAYAEDFPYTSLEFNWTGDFLPAMMSVYEAFKASIYKTHITYRYLFDRNKEFERHPVIK